MPRYIFITGGVVSSLGKGLAAASLAALLQAHGFKVRMRKLDPYLNVDPGTMSPTQHGEVFVTEDGAETDLDLGHYERFTGVNAKRTDNVTAGQIYSKLIAKERRGDYLGGTVQVIPHVTNLIKDFIRAETRGEDFVLCEIGGTVGDIEGLPFFEAIRQFGNEVGRDKVLYMHLTLVPYIAAAKELKTKPTQHSVKELRSIGIMPDILLCRADREIPVGERRKIALFCNIKEENVIQGLDVASIYEVPLRYREEGLDKAVLKHFGLDEAAQSDINLSKWEDIVHRFKAPEREITIALVGKYTGLNDAYKSLTEALDHAGMANNARVNVRWVDSRVFEKGDASKKLKDVDAILVPGGFGESGVEGKINAVTYARENKIPFLGICYGMQIAVIEYARNKLGLADASSTEIVEFNGADERGPLVGIMTEWFKEGSVERRAMEGDLGGTMRLGAYPCLIEKGSLAQQVYGAAKISERHRHRYEVNIKYKEALEAGGMKVSGLSPDGHLPEIIELPDHPWFMAVQFHPELKSRPFGSHPLFAAYVKATLEHSLKLKEAA